MEFSIQASNPRISRNFDSEDETLDECIETCFCFESERAFLEWNTVFIPLSYKYCISKIIQDSILMIENLLDDESGTYFVAWPSNEFRSNWSMSWTGDQLSIESQWESVIGDVEDLLNSRKVLTLKKEKFIFEWKKLFETVLENLLRCGYSESDIHGIKYLRRVSSRINNFGILYSEEL